MLCGDRLNNIDEILEEDRKRRNGRFEEWNQERQPYVEPDILYELDENGYVTIVSVRSSA